MWLTLKQLYNPFYWCSQLNQKNWFSIYSSLIVAACVLSVYIIINHYNFTISLLEMTPFHKCAYTESSCHHYSTISSLQKLDTLSYKIPFWVTHFCCCCEVMVVMVLGVIGFTVGKGRHRRYERYKSVWSLHLKTKLA